MTVSEYDFRPGADFNGIVIIARISPDGAGNTSVYQVKCTNCGRVFELNRASLRQRVARGTVGCKSCANRPSVRAKARPITFVQRDCPICDDCQALRPANGTPCVCGGVRNEVRAA